MRKWLRFGLERCVGVAAATLLTLGSGAAADRLVAPGYRVETLISGLPHVLDAIEPFGGVLLVSAGAPSPGGRLLRFPVRGDAPLPLPARSGEAVLWSRARLSPIVTYRLTGRVHVGIPEQGRVVQLSPEWEPDPLIVGLTSLHDLAIRPDGRVLIADGTRVLETPVYVVPPADAAGLRTVHRCAGSCRGVALGPVGELLVLEGDDETGRVVRLGTDSGPHVLVAGLPRPANGLRLGRGGNLFLTSDAGVLRILPSGAVVRIVSGFSQPGRVSLDPDGNPLVTDPVAGEVLRIRILSP